MLELEIFVGKLFSINRFSSTSIALLTTSKWETTLDWLPWRLATAVIGPTYLGEITAPNRRRQQIMWLVRKGYDPSWLLFLLSFLIELTYWIIKLGMIRWKIEFLKCNGLPACPVPFSPVHKARKFSAVFGTAFPNNPMTIRPPASADPSISTSK